MATKMITSRSTGSPINPAPGELPRYADMTINRYLPNWLHRTANAIVTTASCAFVGIAGLNYLHGIPVLALLSKRLLYLSPLLGIPCGVMNPKRFSLVEGCAGDVGYDGLDSEDEGTNKKA
jgi:hypothetical protein